MHKEICLPSSANYAGMGLQVDVLERKVSEPVVQIISVATSFGRAVVADGVPKADAETWAAGLQHQANAGKTRAIQPFLIVNQDLVTGMPKAVRRAMDKIRQRFPSTLVMRMLM